MKRNYYIFNAGELRRKDNSLRFEKSDGEGVYLPVEDVDSVFVFGELAVNSSALNFLAQKGIIVHFFNYHGYYTGSFFPRESNVSGLLLLSQARYHMSGKKRLRIAARILEAGAYNILHNLKYYRQRGKELTQAIDLVSGYTARLAEQDSIPALMGVEGNIRQAYYRAFNTIVDQDIDFTKRVRQPPDNMINTLISFSNSLVYTTVLSEIYKTQLNPLISFLHEPGHRRFSLNLDIAEIFKPLLADRMIFSLLNRNQITDASFDRDGEALWLKEAAAKLIVQDFDQRLATTVQHKKLNRKVSYRQLIRLDLYKLIKHLLGEEEFSGFVIWW